jgi:hypothetical protein
MGRRQTLEDLEDATRHVMNEIQEVWRADGCVRLALFCATTFMYL